MEWIKVREADSLGNGDLIGFDYNNKKILIAKAQDKIYAMLMEYVRMNMLICLMGS
jgi:nitrite reductase/ring-hydroxylating ferredoxin subunit